MESLNNKWVFTMGPGQYRNKRLLGMLGFYLYKLNYHKMALGPANCYLRLTRLFTILYGSHQPIVAAAGKAGLSAI